MSQPASPWPMILSPQGLSGRRGGKVVAALCAAALISILLVDTLTPARVTMGAIGLVPILAAAWLISKRLLTAVVVVAVASRVLAAQLGGVEPLTAGVEVATYLLVALIGRLAASSLATARSLGVLSALHEVAVVSSGLLEPSTLARLVAEHTQSLTRADAACLLWWNADKAKLERLADTDFGQAWTTDPEGIIGRAFRDRAPVFAHDYQNWQLSHDQVAEAGVRRAAAVPLLVGDRAVGVLAARNYTSGKLDSQAIEVMTLMAAQAAPALEAARLHADLAGSERRFRATFDASPLGIARMDLKGFHHECNPAFLQMLGYSAEELAGSSEDAITHPDDVVAARVPHGEMLRGQRDHYRLEKRYIRKDRSLFWGEVTVSLVRDPEGRPRFWFAMVEDITRRKKMDGLRQAQLAVTRTLSEADGLPSAAVQLLQGIGENVGWEVGELWQVDSQAGVLRCVATWHSPEIGPTQLEATTLWTAFHRGEGFPGTVWDAATPLSIPDVTKDRIFVRSPIAAAAGLMGAFGFPIMSRNQVVGVIDFYNREVATTPDADMLGMMADVGSKIGNFIERRRAEDTSTRLGRILDDSASEIFIANLTTLKVVQASQRARSNLGYSPAQLAQMTLLDLCPEMSREQFSRLVEPLRSGAKAQQLVEISQRRKDGSLYPVEARLQLSHAEVPALLVMIAEDVSERRQALDAIRENQERARMLAGIGAELRGSVQEILTLAGALRSGNAGRLAEAQTRELDRIESAGLQLLKLAGDVFDRMTEETGRTTTRMLASRHRRRQRAARSPHAPGSAAHGPGSGTPLKPGS